MQKIILVVVMVLFAAPVIAAPFLVVDPNPEADEVKWYRVTNTITGDEFTTDYGNLHPSGAMIVFDFANHSFAPGEVALEIRAVNVAGESPTAPFSFTMPSGVPVSPVNTWLRP